MSETRDIVEFVKQVEKYPCIYNHTLPEYSNRTETKRAWEEISKKLNCQEHICKEKWRKIRIAFMRSLKHMKSGNSTIRPYYLYDHLTFVLPFIKINDEPAPQISSPMTSEDDHYDIEITSYKKEVHSESEDSMQNCNDAHNNNPIFVKEVPDMHRSIDIGRQKHINEVKKRKASDNIEDNPRKMFLLSLLPDIESFSDEEMRSFRRGIIGYIDNIIEGRNRHM